MNKAKPMVYYIPIEPLEERYTEQWYRWFPEEFKRQRLDFTVIDGTTLTNVVETGTFLDVNSTLFYKAEQLKRIAQLFYEKKIKDGDCFFVADIEFWGIDAIRYLSVLNNITVRITGFCHAGSYTVEDYFAKTAPFAQHYEHAWGAIFDYIFVGTEYHKQQLIKLRQIPEKKIIVTGNPYDVKEVKKAIDVREKSNMVILTNRPDYEKRPNLTLDAFVTLKTKHPDWRFVVTTSRKQWGNGWIRDKGLFLQEQGIIEIFEGISKNQYLSLVSEAKVMTSNSIEENFGYCILEALIFDTVPVLSKGLSHDELVSKSFLFTSIDEQVKIIEESVINYSKKMAKHSNANSNLYEDALRRIVNWIV